MASKEQVIRDTIVQLHCAGNTAKAIITATGFARRTVYDVIKHYNERGTSKRKQHRSRSDRIRTRRFLAGLKRSVESAPGVSIRALAQSRNVSMTTVRRSIKDLGLRSFQHPHRHLLTEAQKQLRLERSKGLLNELKTRGGHVIIFSDEKIFTVDRSHNRRNDRWICGNTADVPAIMSSKKPASVMVFAAITSEGHVMPPFFFEAGQTVTAAVYLSLLKDVVKPWIQLVIGDRPYIFQQDSAPAHSARIVQQFLRTEFHHFWPKDRWPSNSPDCNPCDFYLWGVVEKKVCATPHASVASLKRAISREMARLDAAEVARACRSFRRRIEAVIEAEGDHFE